MHQAYSKRSATATATVGAAVGTGSTKCSNWSGFRRPHATGRHHTDCGKQVAVSALQCLAMSTLEEADLAVVDCTQQLIGSESCMLTGTAHA